MSSDDLWRWGLGAALGAAWNLLSVWVLVRLLKAWLVPAPSRRRVVAWLAVKVPLLYALAFVLISRPSVSLLAFGLGFTASLAVMLIRYALRLRFAHGR